MYLGLAGRELRCHTERDDFEPGADDSFVFGGEANVEYANINDPQNIPTATALDMPVYIRFDDRGGSDAWCVERVEAWTAPTGRITSSSRPPRRRRHLLAQPGGRLPDRPEHVGASRPRSGTAP